MMNKKVFIILFLLYSNSISFAQSVDEIINNHIEALGGMDSIASVKTIKLTGRFKGEGFDVAFTILLKRPYMVKMVLDFKDKTLIQAFDGATAWELNPFTENKEPKLIPEEIKHMKEMSDFEGPLVNYKIKGYTAELIGKEEFRGSEVYKIRLIDIDGSIKFVFVDSNSLLVIKETLKRKVKGKDIESEQYYSNYRKFSGIMIALLIEKSTGEAGSIENVEINTEIDDALFKMPEVKE